MTLDTVNLHREPWAPVHLLTLLEEPESYFLDRGPRATRSSAGAP